MKLHWKFWRRNKTAIAIDAEAQIIVADALNQKRLAELLCRSVNDVLGLQRVIGNRALIQILTLERQSVNSEPKAARQT